MRKVLIGTVKIDKDTVMHNNQFQYAASFEDLLVPKGEYPIYAYENDIETVKGERRLGWRNYIGFEGTVQASNVGGKPGDHSYYHVMIYDYSLADLFIDGFEYSRDFVRMDYELRPEWGIKLIDFVSVCDGKRCFSKEIVLKDGQEFTYME